MDLTTFIVIGALVGLLFVAVGYGQMVWFSRQAKSREEASKGRRRSPLLTLLAWTSATLAVVCLVRASSSRTLPEREAVLTGEELFSVRPRVGLQATYDAKGPLVHKGDVLIRFAGQDGEEGQTAIKNRRRMLEGELELEKSRPLEFDHEIVRRHDAARAVLLEKDRRKKQLISERDGIAREVTQQQVNIDNRRFRAEQDDRAAMLDLKPLRLTLATEKNQLKAQEALLAQGLVSKVEVEKKRDLVNELSGRIDSLEDRHRLLAREQREIGSMRHGVEKTYSDQIAAREEELGSVKGEIVAAQKALELAEVAREADRPRANAQRDKRLHQIELQIAESDTLLSSRGKNLVVEAPFDGRIGFREPSPASLPADNGPLLVLYKPGNISTSVRLEADELAAADAQLEAELRVSPQSIGQSDPFGRETLLPAKVLQRTVEPQGGGELRLAVEPGDRIVRQLAMGGSVPVRAVLRHGLVTAPAFRAAGGFGAVALLLLLLAVLRGRWAIVGVGGQASAVNAGQEPAFVPAYSFQQGEAEPWFEGANFQGASRQQAAPVGFASEPWRAQPLLPAPQQFQPQQNQQQQHRPLRSPLMSHAPVASSPFDDSVRLLELGARMREQIEAADVAPDQVRRVADALRNGNLATVSQIVAGFGGSIERRTVARAGFDLLWRSIDNGPPGEGLGRAACNCAEFLQVMRVLGADRMSASIEHLRADLVAAALAAAERGGATTAMAGAMLKPLLEA